MRKRPAAKTPKPAAERAFAVQGDHITLGQLLKAANIIGSGGEAKFYLAETAVLVNGEPEQRRGRKLYPGDRVVAPGAAPIRLAAGTRAGTEDKSEV